VDFDLSEEQQLLKKTVREFAEAEIAPHSREWGCLTFASARLVNCLGGRENVFSSPERWLKRAW